MYEFEVDNGTFSAHDLPEEALRKFANSHVHVSAIALIPWEEHCTECAMPQCYSTCDLYEARKDGK